MQIFMQINLHANYGTSLFEVSNKNRIEF